MEKKQLTGFIDKYHLAGNANSVRLDVKDNKLSCNFITDDQNVVGSVSMDNFDIDDVTLGVYATSQLTKLLTSTGKLKPQTRTLTSWIPNQRALKLVHLESFLLQVVQLLNSPKANWIIVREV